MESIFKDIRYAIRSLRQHPGFATIVIVTLALGIGANTAIFSVVNAVLLRPLPFRNSERLVMVWNDGAKAAGGDRTPLAVADLLDWRTQNSSYESIGAFQPANLNYTGGETPEQVRAINATTNLLSVLGVTVQIGRDFHSADEQAGAPGVVLLSDHFWRTHFGPDSQVLGRAINLNGATATIIGVMPPNLDFPGREVELWRALQIQQPTRRAPYFLSGVARLKPGVSIEQARAANKMMTSTFDRGHFKFSVLSLNDYLVGDVRPALIALLVAVTFVLLITAVNVANLTLVRAAARLKEISIHSALGATRGRIVRRLMTESLVLALVGGAVGALIAIWGVSAIVKFAPENLPRLNQIRVDGVVLLWTTLVSILSGVIFGLAPAWQSSRLNLNETLKEGGRSSTEGAGRRRGRAALVVAELALAVMLLTGAGLLIRSFWRLQQVDLGINPAQVLTVQMALRGQRYQKVDQVRDFNSRVVEQTRSLPGVREAAMTNSLPPDETEFSSGFTIEGVPLSKEPQIAYFNKVSVEYFQILGIPLRGGRFFADSDTPEAIQVAIINDTFRRRFFGTQDPIGKRLNLGSEKEPDWNQIVGVVGDVKYNGVAEDVQPAIYLALKQSPIWGGALVLKTDLSDPLTLSAVVRDEIRKIDPLMPLTNVTTMEQRLARAVSQPRFRTSLITSFAGLALILACVGIYGVISYSVTQRTHEIGIRMALGARQSDVLRLVIRQALILAVAGVSLGLLGSLAVTRLMSSLLFGVTARDPLTFLSTAALLTATALIASYLPARQAAKVDPLVALRGE